MPPRRRQPPPPPAPPAEPSYDVDAPEGQVLDPETPTIQPRPRILANLPAAERRVYEVIFAAGSKGMLTADVGRETGMSAALARRHAKSLATMQLLKEVPDVRHRNRKLFMAAEFQPFSEISGGAWYHDGRLDTDAINAVRRSCLAQVKKLCVATAKMIHQGIRTDEPRAGYDLGKVEDILKKMALEQELDEVVRSGDTCYCVAGRQQGGVMEAIPCGVCPRIDECSPEGIISPGTCVYYMKWLQLDF
ncbi:hypothetical protein EJB05_41474, partial [Eragrostis curvula]